ncbi:MAG: hypothetical protein A2Z47_12805 [Thermodesulfovibrio sp. RBG_19FT_COMBO_42_12]|nr:MAG: hypothetical protein A2Z47_12805 [Thermodesulfovibrio sp. RBG_19FT_COMBO_42_12]
MQESFDNVGDSQEIRHIADAVINLYASYVHSLLYPYNHPLISDSLRNAFQCLQKAFRKKPNIRLETAEGRLMIDGKVLKGDILVLDNFVSWLNSRNIKALSFTDELTRRELISFHRIISTKKLTVEELSKAMSEKSITSISVHSVESSADDAGVVSPDGMADGRLVNDYVSTMFHMEGGKEQAPFFSRPSDVSPHDEAAGHGLVTDSFSTMFKAGSSDGLSPFGTNSVGEGNSQQAEDARYAECVEALLEHEISEDDRDIIRSIPPLEMAHLLNAMLFKPPRGDAVGRIIEAYFGGAVEVHGEDTVERYRVFITRLKSDLRPHFEAHYASLCSTDNSFADQETGILPGAGQGMYAPSGTEGNTGIPTDQPAFVPRRTLKNSDFIFDFVANGKAVLHDIEIPGETASLFNEDHLSHFQDEGVLNALSTKVRAATDDAGPHGAIISEFTDEAITDASFDVMLNLLESNSLDDDAFRKLEGRLAAVVELFLEKGEFEKVLEVFNSLKTHSLQGNWGAHASAMIRSIFSSERLNDKVVEALRQYGRKQKESVSRLTGSLRSFLIPYLLDALSEEADTSTRRFMMTLLISVRSDVLEHIAKRLRDSRWYVLRNMLYLLRECHGRSYAPDVKDFLENEGPLVRLEALRTLLSFQDPDADSYVINFLRSDVFQLQKGAVRLSAAYRIKYAVPQLIRLLREKDVLGKKFLFKKGIVRALGRIGDGHTVGHLLNICKSKSVLHKDKFAQLKIEIFRTLHNYPAATIGPLIDYGMGSNDKEIVAICKKLMNRYSLSVGKQR